MTYSQLKNVLAKLGADESEAFILLEHFFGVCKAHVLAFPEYDYKSDALDNAIALRKQGEPIQYITGKAYFYGLEFNVSPSCLIPRLDTEVLCEVLINMLPKNSHFLELCTGSGCIPIAIIKNRPDVTCESIELIKETAKLACQNRDLNSIDKSSLTITVGDALDIDVASNACKYDAIVSNPPYIRTSVVKTLSSEVQKEPNIALDGGDDGLVFYRKFLSSYTDLLKPGGFFAFEIGFDQGKDLTSLCESLSLSSSIIKDLEGRDRVLIARRTKY